MKKYRIVTDRYAGYEVQVWRWWFPFWLEVGCNTHPTLERARAFAEADKGRVVEYVE
jgi:hypothetical protein